jgi:hypothetical protein
MDDHMSIGTYFSEIAQKEGESGLTSKR